MTACSVYKTIYPNDIMYNNGQIKAEKIYMAPIYIHARLELGVYSQYTYTESDLEAYAQSAVDIYIYI